MNLSKTCGIYKIINTSNGKYYIGSSARVGKRWAEHRWALRNKIHHSIHLQHAWDKYGASCFKLELIEECPKTILLEREQYYIDLLNPLDINIGYNVAKEAAKPPVDPERSRRNAKANWANGKWDNQLKPFERIDPNTGEVKEYRTSTEAEAEGFSQQSISACCNGKKASYANYYWQFLDGSTPESAAAYEKVFIRVRGIKDDGTIIELSSFDECKALGFNYGKIRACCEGQRGRRTHNGYKWSFIDEYKQSVASIKATPTHAETFCKRIIRESLDGADVKIYDSQAAARLDGFDQRKVSLCCLGKRKTHGGYRWKFYEDN